jgi:hypothetical protein
VIASSPTRKLRFTDMMLSIAKATAHICARTPLFMKN